VNVLKCILVQKVGFLKYKFKDYFKLNGAHQLLVYADDDVGWKCTYYKEKHRRLSSC